MSVQFGNNWCKKNPLPANPFPVTFSAILPTLSEGELANLRGKNQNHNTSKSTKTSLNVLNEWKVKRDGAREFEDMPCHELSEIA